MSTHPERALEILKERGVLRPRELRREGITNAVVARLMERGLIQRVVSGGQDDLLLGYALAGEPAGPVDADQDRLADIAVRHPSGVLCLQSAMRFHGFTDEYQDDLHVAVRPGASRRTSLKGLKVIYWHKPEAFVTGVVARSLGGVPCRITDPARTVADLFSPGRGSRAGGDRMQALALLAERHGVGEVRAALAHATALGWGKSMLDPVKGFLEGWRCKPAHPKP